MTYFPVASAFDTPLETRASRASTASRSRTVGPNLAQGCALVVLMASFTVPDAVLHAKWSKLTLIAHNIHDRALTRSAV